MRRTAAAMALMAGLTGCGSTVGSAPAAATTHTLKGTFTLYDADTASQGCEGSGGYSDISAGASVVVKNASGTVIATSELGEGTADSGQTQCTYTWQATDVPDSAFYTVTVSHRGDLTYSKGDLEQNGWSVSASL